MNIKNILTLAGFVALAEGAGIVGSAVTVPSISGWYLSLAKPDLAPPNWVFAPVWTTLFLLIGIAAFLVWRRRKVAGGTVALGLFLLQLGLNMAWSYIFFGLHNVGGAFVEIILLWLAIVLTIWAFARISRFAAGLLMPYLVWVSFAAYLNYGIWTLNSVTF